MSAGVLGRLGRRACDAAEPFPVILTRALRSMKCMRVLCERQSAFPRRRKSPTTVAVTDGAALAGALGQH